MPYIRQEAPPEILIRPITLFASFAITSCISSKLNLNSPMEDVIESRCLQTPTTYQSGSTCMVDGCGFSACSSLSAITVAFIAPRGVLRHLSESALASPAVRRSQPLGACFRLDLNLHEARERWSRKDVVLQASTLKLEA